MTDEPWLHTGIDPFLAQLHSRWLQHGSSSADDQRHTFLVVARGGMMTEIHLGDEGRRLLRGMYESIAALSRAGLDVIVDDVIYDERVLRSALGSLAGIPVYFVAVRCSLAVAEVRERLRGDRIPGGARVFFDIAHPGKVYDLEIDSSALGPEQAASAIQWRILDGTPPVALDLMRRRLEGA